LAERLSAAIADAIGTPEVRERLAKLSAEPVGGTPAEMAAFMKQDSKRWREVIRAAGVKAD
jgi:tripartite-type tricarboxylate transporter receptor subunit TctC